MPSTFLITGATGALGRALVAELAAPQVHFILLGRSVTKLEALDDDLRALGASATLVPLDLRTPQILEQLAAPLVRRHGTLTGVFACAALVGAAMGTTDLPVATWRDVFTVNVEANWHLLRVITPLLGDHGQALFCDCSLLGAFDSAYSASKSALRTLISTYQKEVGHGRVRLTHPGPMDSPLRRKVLPGIDPLSWPQPQEGARHVVMDFHHGFSSPAA